MSLLDGVPIDLPPGMTVEEFVDGLPDSVILTLAGSRAAAKTTPPTPARQAVELDPTYRICDHIAYLSDRLAAAVKDVENGQNRFVRISMPPRSGKSVLTSIYTPVWLLRLHPDWKIGLISHDPVLASSWGRDVRSMIEQRGDELGLTVARDAGAVSNWQTTERGGIVARSAPGQSLTGLGFKVIIIDDVVKDFTTAHSEKAREAVWQWWTSNAFTRMEPPYLVIVVGTRWHQDDFLGRLSSNEYSGNPDDWEVIELPAIAKTADVLGRKPGDPLYSPLINETREEAIGRWEQVEQAVGAYMFAALYQQRPSPAQGTIFDVSWWRYWTTNPESVSDMVHYLDPEDIRSGTWVDSWDMAFKDKKTSDYVVGQRWLRSGPYRYLIYQTRARRSFTGSLSEVKRWCDPELTPYAKLVHKRLIEDKANGPAIIQTLSKAISGIKPVDPKTSKEARMRAVTPEIESGHVLLPYPGDPGNEWVTRDLLEELREAPHGAHDDQADALTMALLDLRGITAGSAVVPQAQPAPAMAGPGRSSGRVAAARTMRSRRF